MTIPLDNLYYYIDGLFPEPVNLYLFYPHGSRNILNLTGLKPFDRIECNVDGVVLPRVICNDQEPLNYEFYQTFSKNELEEIIKKHYSDYFYTAKDLVLYKNINVALGHNIYDNSILLHSEKNSIDLEKYKKDGFIDVYYWCHAFIAKDWYRFSEHDARLITTRSPHKDFLIYCRDWSGTREYRIKFQELLYKNNLTKSSVTNIKKINSEGQSLNDFVFKNQQFVPENIDFLYQLTDNHTDSVLSAEYCPNDFVNTHISVVLETVFDGSTIHLTEKILRPIACGHPFILAAGPGSLEYLRSYGFKTFEPWIDESYDLEHDSVKRLEKIIQSMKRFSQLPIDEKNKVHNNIKKIAKFNKKWFFSKKFSKQINDEFIANINHALIEIKKTRSFLFRKRLKSKIFKLSKAEPRKVVSRYLKELKKLNPPAQ